MKQIAKVPSFIKYILSVYSLGIGCFFIFRLLLLFSERDRLGNLPEGSNLLLKAFFMGFRFDTVISGYLLALPILILAGSYFFNQPKIFGSKKILWLINILYLIAILIHAVDIPYFAQFFMRLNVSVFNWLNNPLFVFKMIFGELRYSWTAIPFVLLVFGFMKLNSKFYNYFIVNARDLGWNKVRFIYFLIFALLTFGGIRGRVSIKSPIRIGTAYFSNYALPNQLGLNPVFTFLRSYFNSLNPKNRLVSLMDDKEAIQTVKNELGPLNYTSSSPISREIVVDSHTTNRPNVVMVIMESMSAGKMGRYGNGMNLTPNLDSLAAISTTFDNIYTSGIHTYNGIYSTLFSYPALYEQHPMKGVEMLTYEGLPSVLKKNGYSTTYFTTHDEQFDNVAGFLSSNGIETIYSQKDYPSNEVKSTLGVPDDFMFRYSIPVLDDLSKDKKPFFVSMMTASDHGPYIIPEYFQPKSEAIKDQIVEYADWSIGQFLNSCSSKSWFENTIFVFVADHGGSLNSTYDMPLNYHHSPLIFYNENLLKTSSRDDIGGQIDIFPTLMGYLNISYTNNTLGVDLNKSERPFIYFCADNKYGVINKEYFFINRKNGKETLYKYQNRETANYLEDKKQLVSEMKLYSESMMQTAQYLISNKKTAVEIK